MRRSDKPDNNGLEPAQADRMHDVVRAINKSLANWVWCEGSMKYTLPSEIARNGAITSFLERYFTHALLKTTAPSSGGYLLIERIG